jgi:SAM-dependent methyltransferase
MESADFRRWCERLGHPFGLHRKFWEHCYIAQALHERGMLRPGRRGLGFGVGKEPLAACFASMGCRVVATDLAEDRAVATGWADGRQHANSLAALNEQGLCDPESFRELVSFRFVDMNAIPDDLRGFDFTWSSCSFEHVGSIDLGMRFVAEMLRRLRPGGVAVHTTEFNLSSDEETLSEGPTVLFRRRDILAMADRLAADGYRIDLDLDPGDGPADRVVDVPPYRHDPHLKLRLDRFVSTSIGLIIEKAGPFSAVVRRLRRRLPSRRAS